MAHDEPSLLDSVDKSSFDELLRGDERRAGLRLSGCIEEAQLREKSSSDSHDGDIRTLSYPALEGGWAWVVVLAGFTLHVLTRGCLFSTGVLFSEWTSSFGKSKRDTALVGSIATGCALMLGPLASRFLERWGCRVTAMIGGAISAVGFLSSYWANGVYFLYLTYGLLAGTGMGVSYLCGVVAVGEYFDERRSMAFGIAAAGAGCGASVMAVLQRELLEEYGWQGTMIILAGLSGLNQVAFGALLRPLSSSLNWKSKAGKKRLLNHHLSRSFDDGHTTEISGSTNGDPPISLVASLKSVQVPDVKINTYSECVESTRENDLMTEHGGTIARELEWLDMPRERTLSDVCKGLKMHDSPSLMLRRKMKQALESHPSSPSLLPKMQRASSNYNVFKSDENMCQSAQTIAVVENHHRITAFRRVKRSSEKISTGDATYLSSISVASSRAAIDAMLSQKDDISGSRNLCETQSCISSETGISKSSSEESNSQRGSDKGHPLISDKTFDPRYVPVLRNPLFLILAVNQFFTGLGIMVPFVHLTEKAILMGISEVYAAYLVAVIGIANVIGKVLLGYLCDRKWTDIFIIFVASQIGLAVSVLMFPLLDGYWGLVIASVLFGFFYGNYSAIPSLTAEYVGLHNLAQAIGYINFLEGLAGIIGPPLAGAIYDSSLDYDVAFAVAGSFLVMSSLVLTLQPYFYKRMTRKKSTVEKLFARLKRRINTTKKSDIFDTKTLDHNANCLTFDDLDKKELGY